MRLSIKEERKYLEDITRKGSHPSQKVINALILLNCDNGAFNELRMQREVVAKVLRISVRKIGWVKRRFVDKGLQAALGRQAGKRIYGKKASGDFEARLVALSCSEPPQDYPQCSLRLLAERVVELGYIDSVSYETVRRVLKKAKSNRGGNLAE